MVRSTVNIFYKARTDICGTTYTLTDLGPTSTLGSSGTANSINKYGVIVGTFTPTGGGQRAFLHRRAWGTQGLQNLNNLHHAAWSLQTAEWINDKGQIVGSGYPSGSYYPHAYLLTPN